MTTHTIILYYKYVSIANPAELTLAQKELCQKLELTGRVLIAEEGINGTLEGTSSNIQAYIDAMKADSRFKDINWKMSEGTGKSFPKLSVKHRKEIVATGMPDKDFGPLHKVTGKFLSAEELHKWYQEGREFYVLDMRNDFEYEVGKFVNSIFPEGLYRFRNLPEVIEKIAYLKDKTVVTVCTGGVRCETASGLLMKYGFKDVYQLENGIVTFMEQYPNKYFEGKLYVFDQRMAIGFNTESPEHTIIGKCRVCDKPSEHLVNWNDNGRRAHGIICVECCESGKVQLQQ